MAAQQSGAFVEYDYLMSGNLIQRSPMKKDIDRRLNRDIYKQDSMDHRSHLIDILRQKKLKKKEKRITVSYRPSGEQ